MDEPVRAFYSNEDGCVVKRYRMHHSLQREQRKQPEGQRMERHHERLSTLLARSS
jgi:hypothetical protein